MNQQRLSLFITAIFFLVFIGCNPKDPQPEPVPTELLVTAQVDSVIPAPTGVDFSVVSETGQGPSGTLILWDIVNSPGGNYIAFTYDAQSRLIGTCERTSYGYQRVAVARYQDGLLAESYDGYRWLVSYQDPSQNAPMSSVKPTGVTKFQYDANRRLKQAMWYVLVEGSFKLYQMMQYEYDSGGQLVLTRHLYGRAYDMNGFVGSYPTILQYWENGDMIRGETYYPNQVPSTPTGRLFYNQQVNPMVDLNLGLTDKLSKHYLVGYGPSASGPEWESYQYKYQYDSKGRLFTRQFRSLIDHQANWWTDWTNVEKFVYAP